MVHHALAPNFHHAHGIDVFFFGDRQEGSSGYCQEAWEAFRDEWKASKNPYAIGLGDYGDWLRPTMRKHLSSVTSKDDDTKAAIEKMVLKEHDKTIDAMEFLKGRIIGLHEGHHNYGLMNGTNLDQRLCSALKAPYLGWSATHRLVLTPFKKTGHHSHVITILSTHGNANGRKVHSALAWMDANFASAWIADVYVMGHGCKSGNEAPFERSFVRRVGPPGIDRRVPRIMAVGGFARGWTDGWNSDYVERAGMSPQPLGWGVMRVRRSQKKADALAAGISSRKYNGITLEVVNRFFEE